MSIGMRRLSSKRVIRLRDQQLHGIKMFLTKSRRKVIGRNFATAVEDRPAGPMGPQSMEGRGFEGERKPVDEQRRSDLPV